MSVAIVLCSGLMGSVAVGGETGAVPVVSRETRTSVAVTIYNQDLALVREVRETPLASGESEIRFEDVASRIDPRTVAVIQDFVRIIDFPPVDDPQ